MDSIGTQEMDYYGTEKPSQDLDPLVFKGDQPFKQNIIILLQMNVTPKWNSTTCSYYLGFEST